jgi:hypothetical protein
MNDPNREAQRDDLDDDFVDDGVEGADGTQDNLDDLSAEELEDDAQSGDDDQPSGDDDVGQRPPRVDPELERLRLENEQLRQRQTQQQPSGPRPETDEEFQRRIASLKPLDQMNARMQRAELRSQQQLAYIQATTADQLDRTAFNARVASDKRFAKYADEVERRHQAFLAGGPNQAPQLVARETILKMVIGERVLGQSTRDQRRQGERQQRRIERQRVNPPNNRGDVGSGRQDRRSGRQGETEAEARARRLENVEI